MHNAALAELARHDPRFARWKYFRFEVAPEDLPAALPQFFARGFLGLNLTVPHKVLAFDLVDVSPAARPVGAVNTLRRTSDGWEGHNTDGYGLASAVREDLQCELSGRDIILLGAGGAARGAAVECLQRGCASLAIANRTAENLETLLHALRPIAGATPLRGFSPAHPPRDLPAGALVINATSAGLRATDPLPIDLATLPRPSGVYDMIYNPPKTALLKSAEALGVPHANGLSMLIHQGARALEIWTAAAVPVATMSHAAHAALKL